MRAVSLLSGKASANFSTTDMSFPKFVKLVKARLPGAGKVQVFSGRGTMRVPESGGSRRRHT